MQLYKINIENSSFVTKLEEGLNKPKYCQEEFENSVKRRKLCLFSNLNIENIHKYLVI